MHIKESAIWKTLKSFKLRCKLFLQQMELLKFETSIQSYLQDLDSLLTGIPHI